MRLSRSFQACGGRTVPHVDGVAIPVFAGRVAGSPVGAWWKRLPIVQVQFGPEDWRLCAASPDGQSLQDVSPRGQNHLFANDQVWAAELDGYRDSRGYEHPDWAPVAIDDLTNQIAVAVKSTGALAVWDGAVLVTVEPTGPDLWSEDDLSFHDGLLAYRKGGVIRTWPERFDVARIPAAGVVVANGYALEYQEGRGVVVRPVGSTRGFVVSASGADYGRDMRARPDGTLVVVSSRGPLERPDEFQRYEVNPVLATVNGERREWLDLSVHPTRAKATSRPIAVLTFDDPLDPFTLTGWNEKEQRDWPVDASTVGVLVTWPNDAPAIRDAQHARAVRLGVPLVFYADRPGLTKDDMPPFIGARRLATPRTRITADRRADKTSLAQEVRELREAGFDCLIDIQMTCGFRGPGDYPWTEADMYARAVDAWNVAVDEGALGVLLFNWARIFNGAVVDGIAYWPLFQQFVAEIKGATPDWRTFPKSGTPKPVSVPSPAPTPAVSVEMLMSALTLKKSKFARGSFDPSRFIYPLGNGKNLSIDEATGQPRPGGMEATGPSESFLYTPGSGKAEVDFGTHLYTFLVDENR